MMEIRSGDEGGGRRDTSSVVEYSIYEFSQRTSSARIMWVWLRAGLIGLAESATQGRGPVSAARMQPAHGV